MVSVTSNVVFPPLFLFLIEGSCTAEGAIVCTLSKETTFCHGQQRFLRLIFAVLQLEHKLEISTRKYQQFDVNWNAGFGLLFQQFTLKYQRCC